MGESQAKTMPLISGCNHRRLKGKHASSFVCVSWKSSFDRVVRSMITICGNSSPFPGKLQCCCQWVVPIASKAYSSLLGIAPLFLSEYCLYAARRRLFWAMYGEICCAGEEAVRRKIYVISWGQCEERIRVVSPLSTADWIRPASCILFTKISNLLFICAFAQCARCGNLWVLQFWAFSF